MPSQPGPAACRTGSGSTGDLSAYSNVRPDDIPEDLRSVLIVVKDGLGFEPSRGGEGRIAALPAMRTPARLPAASSTCTWSLIAAC
jgi:hypothetical protein